MTGVVEAVKRFLKWLKPPGPKDLGKADSNLFLPMRDFGARDDDYTWEDWHEEVKRDYPIRYFLTETIPSFFGRIAHRWGERWYRVKCAILPSYRFHLLDLRNPGPGIEYTYGFRDQVQVMMWACFICLRSYIEKEEPRDPAEWATPEELAEEPLKSQKAHLEEARALYDWWMKGRLEEEAEEHRLWEQFRANKESEELRKAWIDYRKWMEDREQEILHRLINIRQGLWT